MYALSHNAFYYRENNENEWMNGKRERQWMIDKDGNCVDKRNELIGVVAGTIVAAAAAYASCGCVWILYLVSLVHTFDCLRMQY